MPVTLSDEIVNTLVIHLRNGGTRLESDLLAMRLIEEAQAPQREAEIQKRIADAVSAATKPTPEAAPNT
jgi:hypothetical protein